MPTLPTSVPTSSKPTSMTTQTVPTTTRSVPTTTQSIPTTTKSVPTTRPTQTMHITTKPTKTATVTRSRVTTEYTTSTVYTTTVRTVTECGPYVTNCPHPPYVTTETIIDYTTICPITETIYPPPMTTEYTTSTVYTTSIYTITECAPWVHDCGYIPYETTEIIPIYTTICPIDYEPTPEPQWTTSTVYTTYYRTVTECEPYCPETPYVTWETVPIYTTVCPVDEVAPAPTMPPHHYEPEECMTEELSTSWSTSTVYTTEVKTKTDCAWDDTWCDYGYPYVTTETVVLSTTLCPEVITEWVPCPTYHPPPPPVVVTSTTTVPETTYTRAVPPTRTLSTVVVSTETGYSSRTNTVYYSTTGTWATSTYATQSTGTSTWMTQSIPTYPTSVKQSSSIEQPSSMEKPTSVDQPSSMPQQPSSVEKPTSML
ncbi:hypothetical protein ACHAO7_010532 [Fusarium culmorum]